MHYPNVIVQNWIEQSTNDERVNDLPFQALYTYDFFHLINYNKLGIDHCTYIWGCPVIIFKKCYICLFKDFFLLYQTA